MYEKTYGSKYHLLGGKYVRAADIAKLIRADLKEAKLDKGVFEGHPFTVAVVIDNYSMGRSIDAIIRGIPDAARQVTTKDQHGWDRTVDTPAARALLAKVDAILQAYNYDGSDIQTDYFDVNYYGHAKFEWDGARAERERLAARAKARKSEPKGAPKPKKADLIQHLRAMHHRSYSHSMRLDLMLASHAALHRRQPHPIDGQHTHVEGDPLLPQAMATA